VVRTLLIKIKKTTTPCALVPFLKKQRFIAQAKVAAIVMVMIAFLFVLLNQNTNYGPCFHCHGNDFGAALAFSHRALLLRRGQKAKGNRKQQKSRGQLFKRLFISFANAKIKPEEVISFFIKIL
jgi:hypothetical protein